jgi:hypothetical protein
MSGSVAQLFRRARTETHHIHEVERTGDVAETPFIALVGVVLFLLPIVLLVMGLAFAAYYTGV